MPLHTENLLRMKLAKPFARRPAKTWAVASVLACASWSAQALSLGQFLVDSGLGQPLRAAIEITNYKIEDLRRLKVQLAEPGSFEQAGMVFHPALAGVQARLEFRGDGKPFIGLTGVTPVNEHFLDVIVEAQWPAGRLAMNYTLLISPVGAASIKPEKAASDATPAQVMAPVVSSQPLAVAAASVVANAGQPTETVIRVKAGDTASKLVLQKMPADVSLDQMLLAMVRANPEAFIEGNVHLLREGAQVQLPGAQEAALISAEEARQTVIAQTVDFVAYARRLAQSTQKATEGAGPEMTGQVSEPPAPLPAGSAQDKLTLSKREITADSSEARMAVEREIQDKTEQLAELKKNLETLKSLSATPEVKTTGPVETSPLKPSVPLAAAESAPRSLLEQVSSNPSVWAWVLALLAGMAGLAWWTRRQTTVEENLFDQPSQSPGFEPLHSGLPPQFASLDLNLTPPPQPSEAAPAEQAAPASVPGTVK